MLAYQAFGPRPPGEESVAPGTIEHLDLRAQELPRDQMELWYQRAMQVDPWDVAHEQLKAVNGVRDADVFSQKEFDDVTRQVQSHEVRGLRQGGGTGLCNDRAP